MKDKKFDWKYAIYLTVIAIFLAVMLGLSIYREYIIWTR